MDTQVAESMAVMNNVQWSYMQDQSIITRKPNNAVKSFFFFNPKNEAKLVNLGTVKKSVSRNVAWYSKNNL